MARLIPPSEPVIRERAQIGGAGPESFGLSQGRELEQVGTQYLEQAKRADQATALSQAMTQATEELSIASNERQQRVTDENGKPMHSTMADDIRNSGEEIRNRILGEIEDPEVARQFELRYNQFASNTVLNSRKVARNQQIDFSRSQLNESLQGYTRQATQMNPEQLGDFEATVSADIHARIASGVISQQEGQQLFSNFSKGAREESYRNTMNQPHGPAQLREMLNNTSLEELGIDDSQKDKLLREIKGKEEDIAAEQDLLIQQQAQHREKEVKMNVLKLEEGILNGTVGRAEVEELRGQLGTDEIADQTAYNKLLRQVKATEKKLSAETTKTTAILNDINKGVRIADNPDYSKRDINNAYRADLISKAEDPDNPSLDEMMIAALPFKAPIPDLQNKMAGITLNEEASDEDIAQTLQGYNSLNRKNNAILDGMDEQAEDILEYASDLYINSAVTPGNAMSRAREAILRADTPIRQERANNYKKLVNTTDGSWNEEGVQGFIRETFDDRGFISRIRRGATIEEGLVNRITPILHDAFLRTGKKSVAESKAKLLLERAYDATEMNGGNHIMFSPPELFYGEGTEANLTTEELYRSANHDIHEATGLDIKNEDIHISSDFLTRGTFNPRTGREEITYVLQYRAEDGTLLPVMNKTGTLLRWRPTRESKAETLKRRRREEAGEAKTIEEAQTAHEESALEILRDRGKL